VILREFEHFESQKSEIARGLRKGEIGNNEIREDSTILKFEIMKSEKIQQS
jgi:hypothetical protein